MNKLKRYIDERAEFDAESARFKKRVETKTFLDIETLTRRTKIAIDVASAEDPESAIAELDETDLALLKTICLDVDQPIEKFLAKIKGEIIEANQDPEYPDYIIETIEEALRTRSVECIEENDPELYEEVCQILIEEFTRVVAKYTELGIIPNHYCFNKDAYLYREYGVRLYSIWFRGNTRFLCEDEKGFNEELYEAVNPTSRINKNDVEKHWHNVKGINVDNIDNMEDQEIIDICKNIFMSEAANHGIINMLRERLKLVVRFMQDNEIEVVFAKSIATDWNNKYKSRQKKLDDRLEFIQALGRIPKKAKHRIMARRTTVSNLRAEVDYYEKAGLTIEQYGPYLGLDKREREIVVLHIIGAISSIVRANEFDDKNKAKPSSIIEATCERVAGLYYLSTIGANYEDLEKYNYTPERGAIACRIYIENGIDIEEFKPYKIRTISQAAQDVQRILSPEEPKADFKKQLLEMAEERGINIPKWVGGKSTYKWAIDRINEFEERGIRFDQYNFWGWINCGRKEYERKITKELKIRADAAEFEELLTTRGLTPPDWLRDTYGAKAGVMRAIRIIEKEYGVQFEGQWGWINSKRNSRKGIESHWRRENRHSFLQDICFIYDLEYDDLPAHINMQEAPAVYLKLKDMEEAGIPIDMSTVRQSLRTNKDFAYQYARDRILKDDIRNEKSEKLIRKANSISPIEEAYPAADFLNIVIWITEAELEEIMRLGIEGAKTTLIDLNERRKGIIDALILARASAVDIMYLLEELDFEDLEVRVVEFIDRDLRVNVPLLYEDIETIRGKLDQIDSKK